MSKVIISDGSVDGIPAKVMYYPDSKQTQIYWGGRGKPDGEGHNHATIQDTNPDVFHFIRINGEVVIDQRLYSKPKSRFQRDLEARGGWIGLFREAFNRARRMF
jgi:hypothetical protein